MKKKIIYGFLTFLFLSIVIGHQLFYRNIEKGQRTIELNFIKEMKEGNILIEEKMERIFVTVVDRSGDAHIHLLKYEGVSK